MDNVNTVRRLSILFFILLYLVPASAAFAERVAEVSLRYSRQDATLRIVVDSDEETIRSAVATPSLAALNISFTGPFELRPQKDFPFELARKDRLVTISLKDVSEVKAYRLSSPPRIVFDIRTTAKAQKEPPRPDQRLEQKPPISPQPAPQTTQPGQKPGTAPPAVQADQTDKGKKIRVVMIDAGHGGYEGGITAGQVREKDVNLAVAKDLYAVLTKKGYTVLMTRKVDQPSSLAERINFAGAKTPDVFISVHASSTGQPAIYTGPADEQAADAVKLFSTAFRQTRHLTKSRDLARALARALKSDLGVEAAQRELPLPVLTFMNATAVMIEYPEVTAYTDAKLRDRFVNAVATGIAAHEQ